MRSVSCIAYTGIARQTGGYVCTPPRPACLAPAVSMRRLRALSTLALVATLAAVLLTAPASAAPPAQATLVAPGDTTDPKATPETGKATPVPEAVKLDIDQALTDHLAKLLAFEGDYIRSHGRYFQALPSHSTPPDDGKVLSADRLSV